MYVYIYIYIYVNIYIYKHIYKYIHMYNLQGEARLRRCRGCLKGLRPPGEKRHRVLAASQRPRRVSRVRPDRHLREDRTINF